MEKKLDINEKLEKEIIFCLNGFFLIKNLIIFIILFPFWIVGKIIKSKE